MADDLRTLSMFVLLMHNPAIVLFSLPAQASMRKACNAKKEVPTNGFSQKGTLLCKNRVLRLAIFRLHLVRSAQPSIFPASLVKRGRPTRHSPQHVKRSTPHWPCYMIRIVSGISDKLWGSACSTGSLIDP